MKGLDASIKFVCKTIETKIVVTSNDGERSLRPFIKYVHQGESASDCGIFSELVIVAIGAAV